MCVCVIKTANIQTIALWKFVYPLVQRKPKQLRKHTNTTGHTAHTLWHVYYSEVQMCLYDKTNLKQKYSEVRVCALCLWCLITVKSITFLDDQLCTKMILRRSWGMEQSFLNIIRKYLFIQYLLPLKLKFISEHEVHYSNETLTQTHYIKLLLNLPSIINTNALILCGIFKWKWFCIQVFEYALLTCILLASLPLELHPTSFWTFWTGQFVMFTVLLKDSSTFKSYIYPTFNLKCLLINAQFALLQFLYLLGH